MVVYKRELFHLRRRPESGPEHAIECRSHEVLDDGHADIPEPNADLRYQSSCFTRVSRIPATGLMRNRSSRGISERKSGSTDSLRTIFMRVWRDAGFCNWRQNFTHKPWGYVAIKVAEAASRINLNGSALQERLHLDGMTLESEISTSPRAERPLHFVIGEVVVVHRTARDLLVKLGRRITCWATENEVEEAYLRAQRVALEVPDSKIIAFASIYSERNWRLFEVHFQPVTRDWHPFTTAEQGKLYCELVNDDRRFSIPRSRDGVAPWAIVWDSLGGPRAIVPASDDAVETVYPSWIWHGSRLPAKEAPPEMVG